MAAIKVFALGGLDERGKNMYVAEVNRDIFIFDAGSKIPEKEALGIDTVIPDFSYLKENANRIKGLFISKPADEFFGAIIYLLKDCKIPIYGSSLTIFLLKQKIDQYSEKKTGQFTISVNDNQLNTIKARDKIAFGNNFVEAFTTTTSIPGSFGFALKTDDGAIVYTGDYIFDSEERKNFATDLGHLAEIADNNVLLLLSDSASSNRNDYTSPNHKSKKWVESAFKEAHSKIFVICYQQDLYKISEMLELAFENKRDVFIFGRSLKSILKEFQDGSILKFEKTSIKKLTAENINERAVIFITGRGERLYTRINKIMTGQEEILEITARDTVIVANPPITGQELKHARLLDDLARTDANYMALSDKKVWAMNASYEDIKIMVSMMRPKYFMPINGLHKNFITAGAAAYEAGILVNNILIKDNGQIIEFNNGKLLPQSMELKPTNIYVDGLGIGDIGAVVLNERKQLAKDGVMISGVTLNRKTKKIVSTIDIRMHGVIQVEDNKDLITRLKNKVQDIIELHRNREDFDNTTVKNQIRTDLQEICRNDTGKSPMVLAIINEINEV